jgi:hypothetical protein
MPELKMPAFLVDLYWDLRDRHLLPLVGLVIVAIVAVPFLLSGGSGKESPAPAPAETLLSVPSPEAAGSKLTVVEAKPGLRDYRKRLRADHPTDPFVQRYTSAVLKGTKLGNGEGASSSTTSTSTTKESKTSNSGKTTTTEVKTESGGHSPAPAGAPEPGHLTLFAFAIDVKIVRTEGGGAKPKSESNTRHKVMPTTPLPGEKAPVVTYMGVGPGAKKALLMVSNNVKSIFGEAKCLSGTDTCQLLEVEPGFPETFVYGENAVRYKIDVLKIEPIVIGHG